MEVGGGGGVVPESITEAANRSSTNFEEFRTYFLDFLPLCDSHILSELDPLQRAQALLLLAKATTTLFTCISFYLSLSSHIKNEWMKVGSHFDNIVCLFSSEAALQWCWPRWPSCQIGTCRVWLFVFAHLGFIINFVGSLIGLCFLVLFNSFRYYLWLIMNFGKCRRDWTCIRRSWISA